MNRRTFLEAVGTVGTITAVGGCLGSDGSPDANGDVVLPEPDRRFQSSDVPYPAWSQQIPDVTVPAPVDSREVRLREIETASLLTFFYSHCQTVCPVLISAQRNIQAHA
jgi:protein SCO1/2